jgi:hypothetical protein
MDTFDYVMRWLERERFEYQPKKFDYSREGEDQTELRNWLTVAQSGIEDTYWDRQLANYYHRAHLLNLETPNGRQALAKFAATAIAMLEATVEVYGELPEPGVSSGNNLDRLMPKE